MLITFKIVLLFIFVLSAKATLATYKNEEYRLKSVSLAIASMITLFLVFLFL